MDCAGVASVLVAYHYGTAEAEERDGVDAHLLSCRSCLLTYIALKHAADATPTDRPSPETRARLRGAVARTFQARPSPSASSPTPRAAFAGRLFARRVPLYQAVAGAAIAAAIALTAPRLAWKGGEDAASAPGASAVDTSRLRPESLSIY